MEIWKSANEVMSIIAGYSDVLIANEDVQKSLGITIDVDVESGKLIKKNTEY